MNFESLSLSKPLLRSLEAVGYSEPTPIQQETIPHVLKGRDVVGCAQTGTGKTAAFALPTLQRLMESANRPTTGAGQRRKRSGRRVIRSLILSPTRELAAQIGQSLATYGSFTGLRNTVIYGGVKQHSQVKALRSGVDILVATPGRLLDLIGQGHVHLDHVEVLILDEADQMLDMGFILDLRKIVAEVPGERQTLMFSATMPPEIRSLAKEWLRRPYEVQSTPVASTPKLVSQSVYFVERQNKQSTLTRFLQGIKTAKTLVFSRTKRGADKIAHRLQRDGIRAISIHGDKSQSKRQAVIRQFNTARPPVLVATDLASRGLDFSDISYVINYDLPNTPEIYVHRIGRTARAGAAGQAVTFCSGDERQQLRMIEKLTGIDVPVKKLPGADKKLGPPKAMPEVEQADQVEVEPNGQDSEKVDKPRRFKVRSRRTSGSRQNGSNGSSDSSDSTKGSTRRTKRQISRKRRKESKRAAAAS